MPEADVAFLADELWLELIVDLRAGPDAVAGGRGPIVDRAVSYLNAPLCDVDLAGVPVWDRGLRFSLAHLAASDSPLQTVVRVLCALAGRPVLLHCSSGITRTSLVTAVLLKLLGVRDDDIVADYLRSGASTGAEPEYACVVEARIAEATGISRLGDPSGDQRFDDDVRTSTIRGLLGAIDHDFGGAESWARSRGISSVDCRRLREGFLVPK